jgi:transketolase
VGMSTFGASAPGNDLFQHFGITVEKVKATAKEVLSMN